MDKKLVEKQLLFWTDRLHYWEENKNHSRFDNQKCDESIAYCNGRIDILEIVLHYTVFDIEGKVE